MRNLNLDQLQTLVAIADLGTFAAAAQALHLAPPTVSLHIKELESRMDAQLLVRGRKQAELTAAGQVLVDGLGLGQGYVLIDVDVGAQGLVGLGTGQKVLRCLDRGDFALLELGGQLGHAQVMQISRSAHANLGWGGGAGGVRLVRYYFCSC